MPVASCGRPALTAVFAWASDLVLQRCLPTPLQVPPLLSPEQGFPMQKACTGLLLDALDRLVVSSSDGCCYLLDPETLQRTARLILHSSLTGGLPCPLHESKASKCTSAQVAWIEWHCRPD